MVEKGSSARYEPRDQADTLDLPRFAFAGYRRYWSVDVLPIAGTYTLQCT